MDQDKMKQLGDFFKLMGGILFGNSEKVKEMLNRGISVDARFIDFDYDEAKVSDINPVISETDTPLLVAVKSTANAEIIKLLLDSGANVEIKDESGKTALDIAQERKLNTELDDVVKLLKDYENHN